MCFYFIIIILGYSALWFYQDKMRFSLCTMFCTRGSIGTINCLLVGNIVVNYLLIDLNYPILSNNNISLIILTRHSVSIILA